jgi:hypothetical protein
MPWAAAIALAVSMSVIVGQIVQNSDHTQTATATAETAASITVRLARLTQTLLNVGTRALVLQCERLNRISHVEIRSQQRALVRIGELQRAGVLSAKQVRLFRRDARKTRRELRSVNCRTIKLRIPVVSKPSS